MCKLVESSGEVALSEDGVALLLCTEGRSSEGVLLRRDLETLCLVGGCAVKIVAPAWVAV